MNGHWIRGRVPTLLKTGLKNLAATAVQPIGEKCMTFRDLDWQAFKQIQTLLTERTRARFAYDNGVLEITRPLEIHERSARLIERFILILVIELGMKIKTMGSTTLDREDLLKSAEPDTASGRSVSGELAHSPKRRRRWANCLRFTL
jgi:Uma2 family endonuclease